MTDPIKAEPVAWMYELAGARFTNLDGSKAYTNWRRSFTNVAPNVPVDGLRNLTPLYTADQLVEERKLAWNEAIDLLRRADDQLTQLHGYCYLSSRSWPCVPADEIRATINAIRALTKDSTHD